MLPRLEDFPVRTRDNLRFGDTDLVGHVNNAAFATYLETGRVEVLGHPRAPLSPPGTSFVLAHLAVDFHSELSWPGAVDVGTRLARVGRSSIAFAQALFQDGRCAATAETVVVLMDLATRRSTPLPAASIAALHARFEGAAG